MKLYACAAAVSCVLFAPIPVAAQQPTGSLTVVSAGPVGETGSLEEANEIRMVFSEPMVALGRIPTPVTAPFVSISPAILGGTFRWSGTTILIYTPDPKRRLPFSTRYTVTVDGSAAATSGRRLAAPYTFTFTTPTVKLRRAEPFRRNGRYDGPMLVALRFNQPVTPSEIVAHLTLAFEPHEWDVPQLSEAGRARLQANNAQAIARFEAKVQAAARAAASNQKLAFTVAADWDKKRFPPSSDLVVIEITVAGPHGKLDQGEHRCPGAGRRRGRGAQCRTERAHRSRGDVLCDGLRMPQPMRSIELERSPASRWWCRAPAPAVGVVGTRYHRSQ